MENWTKEQHQFYNHIYDKVMLISANPKYQVKHHFVKLHHFQFWNDGLAHFSLDIPTTHEKGMVRVDMTIDPDLRNLRDRFLIDHLDSLIFEIQSQATWGTLPNVDRWLRRHAALLAKQAD